MRSAVLLARALLVFVLVVVAGPGDGSAIGEPLSPPQLPGCPIPEDFCFDTHDGATATAWCSGDACFEMNRTEELRVVAADDQGDYPKRWFVWHEGALGVTASSCVLTDQGKKKTRLDMPGLGKRCRVSFETAEHLYYEHFASNPDTGCLGWLECKVY